MTSIASSRHGISTEMHGSILLVHLDRPEVLNAYDDEMLLELGATFRLIAHDDECRAVVLTGRGRGFCTGADLRAARSPSAAAMGLRHRMTPVILAITTLEKPVIAAINGAVAGAGLGFIGAADMRIAAHTAVFVPATNKIGLTPDAGTSFFLPRLLGPSRAFRWLSGGAKIDSATALEWGLIDELAPPEQLLPRALALATELSAAPGAAVGLTKRLLASAQHSSLAEQLEFEHQANDAARLTLAQESEAVGS